ncbi:MAG: ribosome maturation factor RimM [Cyanothece sp. SIO1E1]|nr:ribosome maturation factor RimM [Cyanothece sp. SIO1E1]
MTDWLKIGKIVGAQGLKGEVRVYPDSDFPERFEQPGQRWLLCPESNHPQPIELVHGRYLSHKGLYILRFSDINDREQAESLRGCQLMVPTTDRPSLQLDEFHVSDLLGLDVFNQLTREKIGIVIDVFSAGNDLLEVKLDHQSNQLRDVQHFSNQIKAKRSCKHKPGSKTPRSTVLIPFVKAIVPVVDLVQGRIEITPPAGLIE